MGTKLNIMSNSDSSSSSGVGVLGLLGVAFVILKLTHYINWSWWWVTLPFWGGIAIILIVLLIWLIIKILTQHSYETRFEQDTISCCYAL